MDYLDLLAKKEPEINIDRILFILGRIKEKIEECGLCRPSLAMKHNELGILENCQQMDPDAEIFDIITILLRNTESLKERQIVTKILLSISGYNDILDMKEDIMMIDDLVVETIATAIDVLKIIKEVENAQYE